MVSVAPSHPFFTHSIYVKSDPSMDYGKQNIFNRIKTGL